MNQDAALMQAKRKQQAADAELKRFLDQAGQTTEPLIWTSRF